MSEVLVCGVDEAGRGPLAGPVVAAAVILDPRRPINGLADSKRLSPGQRDELWAQITERSVAWSVGRAEVDEIDRLNILQAGLLAMRRAVEALEVPPGRALIDGNRLPVLGCDARAIVGGDDLVVRAFQDPRRDLAKVTRDREMLELHRHYPGYGLDRHKGYPTRQHLEALALLGPSPIHRRSFGPVARLIDF